MEYDALIVGGGAAGLFCALHAARGGKRVLVLERRERPARKLLITGKGRCNLTNLCDRETFLKNVVRGSRFLYSALSAFPPEDTMACFEGLGVALKVERGQRVFPCSDKAMDVVDALISAVRGAGCRIAVGRAESLIISGGGVLGVQCADGTAYRANAVVVATGGMSYPKTGSTGDGYRLAGQAGHTVSQPAPGLISIDTQESFVRTLAGLSLRNTGLALYDRRKKNRRPVFSDLGEMLFTHAGVSGPMALSASSFIDPQRMDDYELKLDLKPGLTPEMLDKRLLSDFSEARNRDYKNALPHLLPHALTQVLMDLSKIPPGQKVHSITREQRAALGALLKGLALHPSALGPIEEAIITRGGVALKEIDPGTMRSKCTGGLYFIGEVLDADALTGGYNLQIAFSTAVAAARSIAQADG